MSRHLALLALALVGATACSSTSSSGGTVASTTTSTANTTTTTVAVSTTTTPSTTVVATLPATIPPTAPPATNAPKPPATTAAPAPAGPRLDSVSLKAPLPSCNPGDVLTLTIDFSGTNFAAVKVFSSFDGELGQYPAEYGSVDVLHTCISGQTTYTLTPVAEGGAQGSPLDLYV